MKYTNDHLTEGKFECIIKINQFLRKKRRSIKKK